MDKIRLLHAAVSFIGALAILGFTLLLLSTPQAHLAAAQASIVVDTLDDELNNDGDCSLREAIEASNTNSAVDGCPAGGVVTDTISFGTGGTIVLGEPLWVPTGASLVIDGGETITLSGNSQVRLFVVFAEADLSLRNISLVDGYHVSQGGGIYNFGNLVIEHSNLSNDQAGDQGGAVYNAGTLSIEDSTLSNHHAGDQGGAIYNAGTLQILGSILSDNSASFMKNELECTWPYYSRTYGGGIFNNDAATLYIANARFLRNNADMGGGIYGGNIEIRGSSISGSQACEGAGIYTWWVAIIDSSIYDNHAVFPPGADFGGQGGGIWFTGLMTITNTTISSNQADDSGGGIFFSYNEEGPSVLTMANSTLYGNSISGANGGSNIWIDDAVVSYRNNIVAGGVGGANCGFTPDYVISDLGFNMEDADTCGFSGIGSRINTNPRLGPLQDNGGPTWTHALLPGSPAIDPVYLISIPPLPPIRIYPSNYPPADQRGVARPVDGDRDGKASCDIGAYEFRQPTSTRIISDLPDPSPVGTAFTTTFSVTTTVGIPTGYVTVDSGNGNCSGELVAGTGNCQMALTKTGTYTLTANYSGDSMYEFSRDMGTHEVFSLNLYLPLINAP